MRLDEDLYYTSTFWNIQVIIYNKILDPNFYKMSKGDKLIIVPLLEIENVMETAPQIYWKEIQI